MSTVSIVLPSYDGEKYIRESVDSICGQTYTDWELIIVDDCSQDNTLEIAREYETKDDRIHVVHNETNKKLPGSLNIGFRHTKGKYLTWTSDDNIYLPDALSVMVERMETSGAAMVCADMHAIDDAGKLKWDIALGYREEELSRKNTIGACFLYRREVYDSIGDYDTDLYCVEDYDYWLRIKREYGRIERIEQILYQYRYHEESLSATKKEMIRQAMIQLRKKHLDFILEDFQERKEFLAAFYYEMMEKQTMDEEIQKKIQSILPELRNDRVGKRGGYIIFGAGEYGKSAMKEVKELVAFFADNNSDKVGKFIDGKEILSFNKMVSLAGQYDILIAIKSDNVYRLIHQLLAHGVGQYCTWQNWVWEQV